MNAPPISPGDALMMLGMIDYAERAAPGGALPYLLGYCTALAKTPPTAPSDPRREPDDDRASSAPPPGPAQRAALARVSLTRKDQHR